MFWEHNCYAGYSSGQTALDVVQVVKNKPLRLSERLICVIRLGFEPKTHSLEGCCSIQLSYRTDPYVSPFYRKVGAKVVKFFLIANCNFDLR